MNYLKQALTEYLSGLTTKKNEKEIYIKGVVDLEDGRSITVEPIDDENYILRMYWDILEMYWGVEGLCWEEQWKNDLRHGVCKGWNTKGQLSFDEIWEDGILVKKIK